MANVYWMSLDGDNSVENVNRITKKLLETFVEKEAIELDKVIPLKVHFGEKGNHTYIKSENYLSIIDFLRERDIETSYMETSVMYGGQRHRRDLHIKTAKEHGFTQLPIVIADGEQGEAFHEIRIDKKHFETCKIGADFAKNKQMIVISHFKGHAMAGFGGAIKQLSMGMASKGGKMAMHMGIKPHIVNRKCKQCNLCKTRCNEDAIFIGEKSYIDQEKCVGCGACVSICPHKAVSIFSAKGIANALGFGGNFKEKLVEYAYAAQIGKQYMYFNFAMNITRGCDCEPRKMKPIMEDLGIFLSSDPVAIDQACIDEIKKKGKSFRGTNQLQYAEKMGFGSTKYRLIKL